MTVTLYHWDLPHALEEQGGWLNADIAVWFEEYARACFVNFGDRVKFWITLNEPYVVAHLGYGIGIFAPGISGSGTSEYIAAHNLLRAHAKAYRLYEREFKNQQGGIIGITLDAGWPIPEDDSQPNIDAAERNIQFDLGWFANPIFSENGDYPQIMKEKIAEKSQLQGYEKSRLPEFTQQEIIELKGSSDFFGHNFYRGFMVADFQSDIGSISQDADKDTFVYADPTWYTTGSSWLNVTPFAMRSILNWIKTTYNNPKIYITENGVSDKAGNLDDFGRVYWYKHYINNVLKATMDGADVKGYFAWSLMDNFEWNAGYTEKFGLHSVNFTDPALPRRPKKSTELFSAIVRSNGFIEGLIPCE
ncbi:hypothetical protein QYM36_014034 [Artemia franciscana]|uniref:beta-glucosidase n=1 Tax=Artemia franciscana TaxID=6661 RepID=A0AA88HNX3_ARTSF|nr:hypothetical protein QYM36_014034 [Artemia franciscana]